MKRWLKWAAVAAVLVLLAVGVLRAMSARKAQQAAVAAASAAKTQTVVELAADDIVVARTQELARGLPVSGTLRAFNSASVKARVAGELQDLAVREGDVVRTGQVLARVDATEYRSRVRQAQEQADSARAQIDIAQRQYDNNKALVDQGFISRTALDTSLATLSSAQSTYKAAQAAVEVTRKSLDDTVLRAPISGHVSLRAAQPGERVAVDTKVLEIVDLSRLELEATLGAADSMDVRVGQAALLKIEGSDRAVTARVVRINPSAQAGSRGVLVYLGIDDATGLRQGLFAQGTLATSRLSALAVPLGTVRTDKPTPYVQLVENNQVVHRPVELGARGTGPDGGAGLLVAVKGIAENATVLGAGVGLLREGTQVRLAQTATPAAVPAPAPAAGTAR